MSNLTEMFVPDFLHILFLLLSISLIASAILLILKPKKGIILNFIQFPLRILFVVFSFWFIAKIFSKNTQLFFVTATFFEFARIITEIFIYKKLKQ